MMLSIHPTRRLRSMFAAALLLCVPVAALAHAHPKKMTPEADSVGASPARVTITFSEALEPKFSSITVTDKGGAQQNKEASHATPNDPMTLSVALPTLAAGPYIVHWTSVALDGHRLQGEYTFNVK